MRARIPYQPALDGLRGLSVAAILLFHSGFDWARGGFLGVSAFFTLSGYLITSLLVAEREAAGGIGLRTFWARRLRRLMPAALLGLGLCVAYGAVAATPEQLSRLRGDVIWALAYAANWRFVLTQHSYTALFAEPSPVLHFWSLAIEEQFYVVYPLLVAGVLLLATGSRRALGAALAGLTLLSVAVCAGLRASGASLDRVYFGTDTRAAEFLAGALLALVLDRAPRASLRPLPIAGVGALALLLGLWSFTELDAAWLYRGGLAVHAALVACVVAAAVQPAGGLRALLAWGPLRGLGRISYGVYVYHWPLFLWLDAERTGLAAAPLLGLRLGLVLALAALSHRFVEHPIRRGGALRGWRPWLAAPLVAAGVLGGLWLVTQHAPEELDLVADVPPAPAARRPGGPPRVALFGDSTAMAFQHGVFRWLEETGRGEPVQGAKRAGCGIADEGFVRSPRGKFKGFDLHCMRIVERFWASAIEEGDPDVAVVLLGTWDLRDRRFLRERRALSLGDPELDAYLRRELLDAVDVLSARGAGVAWLTIPIRDAVGRDPAELAVENEHIRHYNGLIRELEDLRSGRVRVVDLEARVEARLGAGGPTPFRHDGVHLTWDGAYELVADGMGDEILAAARR